MRIRRRTSSTFSWGRLVQWLNPRLWFAHFAMNRRSRTDVPFRRGRIGQANGALDADGDLAPHGTLDREPVSVIDGVSIANEAGKSAGSPQQPEQVDSNSGFASAHEMNARAASRPKNRPARKNPLGATWQIQERWLFGGAFLGSLLIGYLVAAIFFFPAPFFSSDESVPRVLGVPLEEARALIEGANLVAGDPRRENHPSYAADQIVWQDPPEGVRVPPGTIVRLAVSRGPQAIPVPDVSRYDSELATTLINRSGLSVRRLDSIQTALPKGVAVGSRPAAGATLAPGSGVILIVSRGAPTISVPDLAGLTLEEAQEELTLLGLTMGRSWQEFSNAQPEGFVFRQEPLAGTLIAPGTPINLVVARTP